MAKVLGLDLGTNSIGWALIDDANKQILGSGSRIFEEGVVNLGKGERELSKNAARRENRGARRQHFRKRLRKRQLLKVLAEHEMCPISVAQIRELTEKDFKTEPLVSWFRINPYKLRDRALKEKLTMHELGRIFYHLIQRRGFQSNSRRNISDDGTIFKGNKQDGKVGITETTAQIDENETLGQMLNSLYPAEGKHFKANKQRIRNRYTTRQMYINEFEQIWNYQKKFHNSLTQKLKTKIGGRKKDGYPEDGVLFMQRPLKSQKHLVGNCPFEPRKTKCPKSAILAEEFGIYQRVNTIEYNNQKLTSDEREKVARLLMGVEKVKFERIRKAINKEDDYYQFNYKNDDSIAGSYTIKQLSSKKYFGQKWFTFSEKEQEDIWHIIYFFEDKNKLKDYAVKNWGFDERSAEQISKLQLKSGYAGLSSRAIRNILPFLKEGFVYSDAVMLGGVKNVLGNKWQDLTSSDKKYLIDTCLDIATEKVKGGYLNRIKTILQESYDIKEHRLSKLYHHSQQINTGKQQDKLPVDAEADKELIMLRNPVVVTALFELRKVINELIDMHGKPDKIVVELARDLKSNKTKRFDIQRKQKRNEEENDRVKAELKKLGQPISHESILKYKLWEECDRTCPYTGRKINIQQLFTGEVQIEHILPWSKTLNNSYMNKTLCFADENRAKGDNSPYEYYFKKQGAEKWEQVKAQALSCFKNKAHYPEAYIKFKQFVKTKYDDDFTSRQLNDTRYISREAKNYLSKVCARVSVSTGQVTAELRYKWGLHTILSNSTDKKDREDHRHHAVDALVLACSTPAHLQELSRWNRYRRTYETKDFPLPWPSFREDAEKSIRQILVSHKKNDRVLTVRNVVTKKGNKKYVNKSIIARGQLHKESVFGKRTPPDGIEAYHIRKPIESRTNRKQINKIVDPAIRKLICKRIDDLGGFLAGDKVPPNTYFKIDDDGNRVPQIFLPNKNGEPVPILKVRVRENKEGVKKLHTNKNAFVDPSNNHHVRIYINGNGERKEQMVSLWDAVKKSIKTGSPYFEPADCGKTVVILHKNDMVLFGCRRNDIKGKSLSELSSKLYKVRKITSGTYVFVLHTVTNIDVDSYQYDPNVEKVKKVIRVGSANFNGIKVRISSTGKIIY